MLSSLPSRRPIRARLYALALALPSLLLLPASAPAAEDTTVLTLTQESGPRHLSLAAIEATDELHHLQMRHPEGPEGRFSGVWLDAFLAANGLEEARRLRFIADDGYTVFLTPAQRREKAYLLATRLDGAPIGAERLGPLMLLVPEDAEAAMEGSVPMNRWIWGLEEIRVR